MTDFKHITVANVLTIIDAAERARATPVPSPGARAQLDKLVDELTPRARAELAAVMWWGRGNEFATFDDAVWHGATAHADYITAKAPLARYLKAGLRKLQDPQPPHGEDQAA